MKDNDTKDTEEIIDIVPVEQVNEEKESSDDSTLPKRKKKLSAGFIKAIIITAAIIGIIVIIIMIVLHLSSSKGIRSAKSISKFIGESASDCEKKMDISLKEQSAYNILNHSVKFDRIYEDSEKTVKADGVTYPEWAVFVDTEDENIVSVRYTDFTIIKDNLLGIKKKTPVNLDRFDEDTSIGTIEDEIGSKPYSITYQTNGTTYLFKYYYTNDSDDKQGVLLKVNFDADNNFKDYKSELIYPPNI